MKKWLSLLIMVAISLLITFWVIGRDFAWFKRAGDSEQSRQEIDRIDKLLTRLKPGDRPSERGLANALIVIPQNPTSVTPILPAQKSIESISPVSSQLDDTKLRDSIKEPPETEILPQSSYVKKPRSEPIVTQDYILDGDNITFRDPSRGTYKTSDEARKLRESIDISQIP